MTKSINKQYKFVYMRNDRYDRSFDGNDHSAVRAKFPKFVIANKNPNNTLYNDGVRANTFMSLYLNELSSRDQKSFNEAEWTKSILTFCNREVSRCRRNLRSCINDTDSYFFKINTMLLDVYKQELKVWKQKHKQLTDAGVYTYLELTK